MGRKEFYEGMSIIMSNHQNFFGGDNNKPLDAYFYIDDTNKLIALEAWYEIPNGIRKEIQSWYSSNFGNDLK